jgi:hypothetical protein
MLVLVLGLQVLVSGLVLMAGTTVPEISTAGAPFSSMVPPVCFAGLVCIGLVGSRKRGR